MDRKPTYEELEQRIRELEKEAVEREKEKDELIKTQSLLLAAIDQTPVGIVIADAPDGNIRIANPAGLGIPNRPKDLLMDIPMDQYSLIWNVFHEDGTFYRSEELPLSQAILHRKRSKDEFIIRRDDGEDRWILADAAPVIGEKGDVIGGVVVFPDITERKRADKALQESEEKFHSLFDLSPLAITISELKTGKIVEVNSKWCELTKNASEQVLGKTVTELGFYSEDSRNRFIKELEASGEVHGLEMEFNLKDDSIINALMFAKLIRIAGKELIFTFFLDLTERKRAEEALRKSEEKYRRIVENTRDIIYSCSPDGIITFVSPQVSFLNYSKEEVVGRKLEEFIHPDDVEMVLRDFQKAIEMGEECRTTFRLLGKNGTFIYVEDFGKVSWDGDNVGQLTGVLRDITEKRDLETRMRQVQKVEAIGSLAGGIAHDFNNILFPIIGYAEMTLDDVPEGSTAQKNIHEILSSANRAKELVQQILSFSRQSEQERRPLKIEPIIKEVLKMLNATLPSTIKINQKIDEGCGIIMADPTEIHQVLMNLCTNAYHAMGEEGGVMTVSLEKIDIASEAIWPELNLAPGSYLKLVVSDTGHGMERAVMEKIFDPYFTTKKVGQGTGLGLAVTHGIVKSYEGKISVYSEPDRGTSFHVYLPAIDGFAEDQETIISESLHAGNEHILLVDDEEPIVRMFQQMLEKLGYRVTPRTSSVEALEAFQSLHDRFDLVITDQTMPNMTGKELAGKLMEIRHDIPIILCTGFSEIITREKAKSIGIRECVMKPVIKSQIAKVIRKVLDQGQV